MKTNKLYFILSSLVIFGLVGCANTSVLSASFPEQNSEHPTTTPSTSDDQTSTITDTTTSENNSESFTLNDDDGKITNFNLSYEMQFEDSSEPTIVLPDGYLN